MSKKLTYEFVKGEFNKRGYVLLDTVYVDNRTKMRYLCSKHGEQSITYSHLSQGQGCPRCGDESMATKRMISFSDLNKLFEDAGYKLLETKAAKANVSLRYLCPTHGERKISYNNLKQGNRCIKCHGESMSEQRRLQFSVVNKAFVDVGYVLLETKYVNAYQKLRYLCPIHGEQTTTYHNLQKGCRCPKCNASKGEQAIQEYLDSHSITYATEYTFKDLEYKGKLRFDFCIFESDKKTLKLLIEYQGIQHYEPIDFAGRGDKWAEEQFIENRYKDKLKVNYCKLHKIPLLTIKYSEFYLLEEILHREILIKGGDENSG